MKMRSLILICGGLLMALMLSGQCLSGDCQNGYGVLVRQDAYRYAGLFSAGQMTGLGKGYFTDGSQYEGEWLNGFPHGKGKKILSSGQILEGIWKNGVLEQSNVKHQGTPELTERSVGETGCISGNCQNGQGMYVFPNGAVYVGEFFEGEIQGVGICYYPDGSKYQGAWKARQPHGNGTKTYVDGSKRTGLWHQGLPVDTAGNFDEKWRTAGELVVQSGCISGDCRNGEGVYGYPDGSRYNGFFREGQPWGQGTFEYANGDLYRGSFKAGFPEGMGQLTKVDGTEIAGQWKEGDYVGATQQLGCIKGDCLEGYGTYIYEDGTSYVGTFKAGVPDGRGLVTYANGNRYEGGMKDAALEGYGTLYLADGTEKEGYWEEGAFMGKRKEGEVVGMPPQPIFGSVELSERPANRPKVWALIIGVAAYKHMPALRYTDDDAYRIYAFLKSPQGGALPDEQINILIDEDATRSNILRTMQSVFSKAGPEDLLFLYFSGHGLQGAFLPIDFDGYGNKLFHNEITALLDRSPAKYKLCIADACHSGSLLSMRGGDIGSILTDYYSTLASARRGTALILSSKSEETSLESSEVRQGVFSHYLIRGLKGEADADNNRLVTVKELYEFVYREVRGYTHNAQSPVIDGDYDENMTVSVRP